jgi:hypothetical protein
MADQSQSAQQIEMPPAYIVGDKPHEPVTTENNNTPSRNIEFDSVTIIGNQPQVNEMPPLEITVPKPDQHSKESAASPESRSALSAPSSETKSQQTKPQLEVQPTQIDKATTEVPNKEGSLDKSELTDRRRSRSDGPFDDHTEAGKLPSFVYPNKPEDVKKPVAKKKKGKDKKKTTKVDFDDATIMVTRSEPKTEEKPDKLTRELAKQIIDAVASDSSFENDNIKGNYYERIFTWFGGRFSGSIREFSFTFINAIHDVDDKLRKIFPADPISAYTLFGYYDPTDPEVEKIVCTGIANGAIEAIKKHPEVMKRLTKLDTTQERYPYTGVAHTAVLVVIGEKEFVFDWYQSLEADNPRVHTYENWLKGDDDKGVYYTDIKNNTYAGQLFLSSQ